MKSQSKKFRSHRLWGARERALRPAPVSSRPAYERFMDAATAESLPPYIAEFAWDRDWSIEKATEFYRKLLADKRSGRAEAFAAHPRDRRDPSSRRTKTRKADSRRRAAKRAKQRAWVKAHPASALRKGRAEWVKMHPRDGAAEWDRAVKVKKPSGLRADTPTGRWVRKLSDARLAKICRLGSRALRRNDDFEGDFIANLGSARVRFVARAEAKRRGLKVR